MILPLKLKAQSRSLKDQSCYLKNDSIRKKNEIRQKKNPKMNTFNIQQKKFYYAIQIFVPNSYMYQRYFSCERAQIYQLFSFTSTLD